MKVVFTENEMQTINECGCTCLAVAKAAMQRSGLNFDDIERINERSESHNWGSNADRAYRNRAMNKAIAKVASNPKLYI